MQRGPAERSTRLLRRIQSRRQNTHSSTAVRRLVSAACWWPTSGYCSRMHPICVMCRPAVACRCPDHNVGEFEREHALNRLDRAQKQKSSDGPLPVVGPDLFVDPHLPAPHQGCLPACLVGPVTPGHLRFLIQMEARLLAQLRTASAKPNHQLLDLTNGPFFDPSVPVAGVLQSAPPGSAISTMIPKPGRLCQDKSRGFRFCHARVPSRHQTFGCADTPRVVGILRPWHHACWL